ncbi:MAG: hypothetical protein L0Y79_04310 [Chlorobi bacterium]|nr:hypothetical protein [Chlorobiota bacterium]MCI0717142.1 hypothetical protein [Chlorobiota bacterium]
MRKLFYLVILFVFAGETAVAQSLPDLKLNDNKSSSSIINFTSNITEKTSLNAQPFQLKKRKTVNSYFGAGYSFIIFTNSEINSIYPLLDTRNGTFLTNISLFFGFAIASAVALEFEPGILFASSSKSLVTNTGVTHGTEPNDTMAYSSNLGLFAIPLTVNVRFFPFYKLKNFGRLFFVGAGGGIAWINEDYDNHYDDNPNLFIGGYYTIGGRSESTSQWAPVFRLITGFTGTGGQFGFGGEVRYNIIPLKEEKGSPFRTRVASNFNSVDINLRFYFSL